jgi:hypothetical protein
MSDDLRLKVSSWCRRVQCLVSSIEHIKERVRARAPEPRCEKARRWQICEKPKADGPKYEQAKAKAPRAPALPEAPPLPLTPCSAPPAAPRYPPGAPREPRPEPRPHARPVYFIRRTAAPALTKRPDITRSLIIYATYYGVKAKSAVDRKRPKRYHAGLMLPDAARRYDKNRLVTRGLEHRGVTDERQRERVSESRQE